MSTEQQERLYVALDAFSKTKDRGDGERVLDDALRQSKSVSSLDRALMLFDRLPESPGWKRDALYLRVRAELDAMREARETTAFLRHVVVRGVTAEIRERALEQFLRKAGA
jgi:hypothetical protein